MQSPFRTALLSFETIILLAVAAVSVYTLLSLRATQNSVEQLESTLVASSNTLTIGQSNTADRVAFMDERLVELSDLLYSEQKRIDEIADNVEGFDRTVGRLSGSVETLEKLTTTDPELLQKYSRVYFLNEHYMPGDLELIDEKYDYANGKEVTIHAEVWPFLEDMLQDAWEDDIELMILSGYRSFEEQGTIKQTYTTQYGTGANTFSADQGYSEHQLGTTVDITTATMGENLEQIEGTDAHKWLLRNAYKYGFVMSYPENNEYYVYEPWHWRFVGEDLAKYLNRKEKNFYDLEQRKIDEYIVTLFER